MKVVKLIETQDELQTAFDAQKHAFSKNTYPSYEQRIRKLKKLRETIKLHQEGIATAIDQDFGCRNRHESKLIDVLSCVLDTSHTIKHLKKWMRPSRRSLELLFKGNKAEVRYQPKGVVGVIVPWLKCRRAHPKRLKCWPSYWLRFSHQMR